MQLLGERAVVTTATPKSLQHFEFEQWDFAVVENMLGRSAPGIDHLCGQWGV
ncbi:Uncharacterised protein [Mycobacterium tuberculosis]|nr:Uncharacterised protein [Mycobacterium tuberculosis]